MAQAVEFVKALDVGRRMDRREDAAFILAMAPHLDREEQMLIEHVFRDGLSAADYARVSGQAPRKAQRRIRLVIQRIYSPEFGFVLNYRELLPYRLRRAARLLFLEGCGLRGTAERMGVSLHTVRGLRLEIVTRCRMHAEGQARAEAEKNKRAQGVQ
ncbi:MAG: hypothetical protein AAGH99_06120 [Planctomycetota bacterium]